MLNKKTVLLAKVESAYGSDPTLAAADNSVMAYEPEVSLISDMKERYPGSDDISRFSEVRGKTNFDIKVPFHLKGSGTAGTAPRYAPLLQCCGLGEVVVSATSVTYAPVSSSFKSACLEFSKDGLFYQALGVVGDLELDFTAGELPLATVMGKGLYLLPTDVAIEDPTFDTTVPQVCKGLTFTFGSYSAIIEKLVIKMNNKIAERPDFNTTDGIKGYAVTERNPEGSMIIEAVLRAESNADFYSYFAAGTVKALSLVVGSTAGNIATLTASYCYLRPPALGNRDGVITFEIPIQLAKSSGNDEFSLVLT